MSGAAARTGDLKKNRIKYTMKKEKNRMLQGTTNIIAYEETYENI